MKYNVSIKIINSGESFEFVANNQKEIADTINKKLFSGYNIMKLDTLRNYMQKPERYKLPYTEFLTIERIYMSRPVRIKRGLPVHNKSQKEKIEDKIGKLKKVLENID